MDLTTKTIFYCYPEYEDMVKSLQKLIFYKAIGSHSNSYKTMEQVQKIIRLNSAVDLLKQLKLLVEEILERLTYPEQELVKIRYFNKPKGTNKAYYTRTYYRNQLRLEKKLEGILSEYGIDEVWFKKNCSDIHFLRERYNQLLRQKQQRLAKLEQIRAQCDKLNQGKIAA